MKLRVVAVGQRQPAWADEAFAEFAKRFPPEMRLELEAVKAEPRAGRSAVQCMAAEARRLEAAIPKGARRVLLDERGDRLGSAQLARRLARWRDEGDDVVFIVGGPDGVDAALAARADERLRLSDLTLPHALARVLLAEALYRAWTLHQGHPYHRE
ncbi:MAG TPA: 23S rRNA (pseudouridine(1915)-N(3))-methyltransferase RlmH [Rubrivivax sp.]|nr:23S rRNA (pseudouridine(1915)-N(3))-methyltransferase RlmH [Burkholderiales bacterium]HNT40204.1 23S rRNA (pseudouridine(1915)-N(3))-methyltransferase RlmH [Rubrivivax sp.]